MAEAEATVFLDVKTSDGTTFKINDFKGVERISDLFEYNLLMTAQSREVNFDRLMGQPATVTLKEGSQTRTYNGIIGRFEQANTPFNPIDMWTVYRATLFPNLWLLTFSGQCRIFQNKSAIDIIKSILDENKIPYSNQANTSGSTQREYCVQYNETDFNFICRLMEEEGIFYYFQQNPDSHMLVLADSVDASPSCSNAASVSFQDVAPRDQTMMKVSSCFITQRIVPQTNTLKSYNYLTPQTPLTATASGNTNAGGGTITTYDEIYDQQSRGDELVKVQLASEDVPQKMVEGASTVPFFLAGYKFNLEKHPRADANIAYILYEVIHEAHIVAQEGQSHVYKNSYQAFPSTTTFRPAQKTPKPRIYGTQTAKVTGKEGEEIYTEEYGRIKVKFHWDPSQAQYDTTSCWIRVATLWAGQTWGTLFTPRVGHEVVVTFIDGDPDRPLVIGSVYNGENKPPYLPNEPTKSTIKSQTSKINGDSVPGYNELRFEDKRESEEIYIHAQKDFKIDIQNDHDITIVGGSRTIVLQAQEEQQETRSGQQSNDSLTLNNGNKSLTIVQGDYSIRLDQGSIAVTCIKGDVSFDVQGNISYNCSGHFSVKAGQSISLDAGSSLSANVGTSATVSVGMDATITTTGAATVSAGGALALSGGGTTTIEGLTVEVTGGMISLNG